MKNFKKILFSFILICTFFCFSKNVLADIKCSYTYNNDDITNDSTRIHTQFLKYVFVKKMGYSIEEFNNYISSINKNFLKNRGENVLQVKTDFFPKKYSLNEFYVLTDENPAMQTPDYNYNYVYLYDQPSFLTIDCPTIIAVEKPTLNFQAYWSHIERYNWSVIDKKLDDVIIDSIKSNFYKEYEPVLLFSDDSDVRLSMAAIYVYMGYYGKEFDKFNDIDSVVDKYLNVAGMKKLLDEVDNSFNSNKVSDSFLDNFSDEIMTILSKIDLASISNDLKILKSYNNEFNCGTDIGVTGCINKYIYKSGQNMKPNEWFDKFMPNSNAKYAFSLEKVLELLEGNDELKNLTNFSEQISDAYKDYNYCLKDRHTAENCIEECKSYYSIRAEYDCSKNSSGSNYNSCMSSYPSPGVLCKDKSASDIQNEIISTQDDVDEDIKDSISKKIVKLYENHGIDISKSDKNAFCSILLGEGKDDGLYPYIRLVLNLIRIAGPILVVLLTAFDGMKVITSFKGDENKKFWNHLKIRLICLVILILVPTIINYIVNLFISSCPINV